MCTDDCASAVAPVTSDAKVSRAFRENVNVVLVVPASPVSTVL